MYIITTDSPNDVNDAAQNQNERTKSDVSNRYEATEAVTNENSDWPDAAVYHKNQEKSLPDLSERQKKDANFLKRISNDENDAQTSPNRGMILSCLKYRKMMIELNV